MSRPVGRGVRSLAARFSDKWTLDPETGCHVWTAALDNHGYGMIYHGRHTGPRRAYRVAFELAGLDIPSGMEVDHLCRNRRCVNIDHLEPVTAAVNILRGASPIAENARKTHCPYGHEYTEANTYVNGKGSRVCRACTNRRQRAYRAGLVALAVVAAGCLSPAQLARLRSCEASSNYAAVSASGKYRGAYQFDRTTWNDLARRKLPHLAGVDPAQAAPADQDAMARLLHHERGAGPWPVCGRRL